MVREIVDRMYDAPIKLSTKSASTKRPFHLRHVASLKKSPGMLSSLFPHPPRGVGLLKSIRNNDLDRSEKIPKSKYDI
jgi:hypothetical protein